jgi:hypothetical protein
MGKWAEHEQQALKDASTNTVTRKGWGEVPIWFRSNKNSACWKMEYFESQHQSKRVVQGSRWTEDEDSTLRKNGKTHGGVDWS